MDIAVETRFTRMQQVLRLERPNRLPMGDMVWFEYRPDIYHLGSPEVVPPPGEVATSRDGKRRFTRDGGVWAVGDPERYQDYTDVLNVDPSNIEAEDIDSRMLDEMSRLYSARAASHFPVPMHYGTLVTRATIEFGWEPFLTASALEPDKFSAILDRFGEASLRVATGWAMTPGTELITIHDDIAATRGVFMHPEWYRRYVFPWYSRIFAAIHAHGRKVLYVSDGNYLPVLEDILATGTDGLYIESSSMEPAEFMHRAGRDRIFMIKTDSRNIDFGSPEDIYAELRVLRELHEAFPGMMMYRGGGSPRPGNAEAFNRYYHELLVYDQ